MPGAGIAAFSYFGREYLRTRNILRALKEEVGNAVYYCEAHLKNCDYSKIEAQVLKDRKRIPYIPWQPTQEHLYRLAIEELYLLHGDLVRALQKAYDAEMAAKNFCTGFQEEFYKNFTNKGRAAFVRFTGAAIKEDLAALKEAQRQLENVDGFWYFWFGKS